MHDLPHHYAVTASATATSRLDVGGDGLPALACDAPPQFGGPGGCWSPESLLVAAVASCFILTFRGVARASQLRWTALECAVEGTLDREDRALRFTGFLVRATLALPAGSETEKARRLLERAEQTCLVTRSLAAPVHLEAKVETVT